MFPIQRLQTTIFIIAVLAGCSGKSDDGAKKPDDGKPVTPVEKPTPKKDNVAKKDVPVPPVEKPPEPAQPNRIGSVAFGEEFRDDNVATKSKYHGKVLEVTGEVKEYGVTATGGAYLTLAGQQTPVEREIEIVMKEPEPWAKVIPGQTVTVRARCEILDNDPRFKEATILDVKGPGRLTVTATELSSAFEKDAKKASAKYGDHFVDLSGEIANLERAADKDLVRMTFKTPGKVRVVCEFTGEATGVLRKFVKPGDNAKVFGKVNSYNAAQGVELNGCLLYAKP